jgi:hypothetical protein
VSPFSHAVGQQYHVRRPSLSADITSFGPTHDHRPLSLFTGIHSKGVVFEETPHFGGFVENELNRYRLLKQMT